MGPGFKWPTGMGKGILITTRTRGRFGSPAFGGFGTLLRQACPSTLWALDEFLKSLGVSPSAFAIGSAGSRDFANRSPGP
jgi:hypothetical protein